MDVSKCPDRLYLPSISQLMFPLDQQPALLTTTLPPQIVAQCTLSLSRLCGFFALRQGVVSGAAVAAVVVGAFGESEVRLLGLHVVKGRLKGW